jgi:hypothetical protein
MQRSSRCSLHIHRETSAPGAVKSRGQRKGGKTVHRRREATGETLEKAGKTADEGGNRGDFKQSG